MNSLKKWWKYSTLRFYVLNATWNYKFWISCKKKYKEVTFFKKDFFRNNSQEVTKRRFIGYYYKDKIYLDNPGIPNIEKDVWERWKNKGLI